MNRFTAADRGAQAIKGSLCRRCTSWMTSGRRKREGVCALNVERANGRFKAGEAQGQGQLMMVAEMRWRRAASSRCASAEEVT